MSMYSHADDGHLRGGRRSQRVRRRRGAATAPRAPRRPRGRADRRLERGRAARRPPAPSAPARGPGRRADHPRGAGRPRRRRARPAARSVGRHRGGARTGHRRHRLRRRLPAHRRRGVGAASTAVRTPVPGPTASPSFPASARDCAAPPGSRCPAATRRSRRSPWSPRSPAGLVTPDVVVVAASGTSGAGKAAKPHLMASEVVGNLSAYGVGGAHRHTPEITQNLAGAHRRPRSRSASPRSWSRRRGASSRPARLRCAAR